MQIFVPTHPLEGELVICPKIEGFFDCEILHPNGTRSKPWDKPQKNTISKTYLNNLFSAAFANGTSASAPTTMTNLLFASNATLVVGTSNLTIEASDIIWTQAAADGGGLIGRPFMSSSTKAGSGNVADVDSTTGNAILTGNWQFAAATSAMTIREAAINSGTGLSWQWQSSTTSNRIWNRVVLPTPVTLSVGDILTMSYTLVIPTLAVTAQTVTLAAQNGMNISGQLKLIGTKASICGGSVTGAGVHTALNSNSSGSGTAGGGAIFPGDARGGLTTATTFPAFNTNTTGMNSNLSSTHSWNTYVTDSFTRTYETVWNTAFATTNFRSANLYLGGGTYGYQLLLDAQQTKELNKALTIGWTFGVQV